MDAHEALQLFGHDDFRPGQKEIIDEAMSGSQGILVVMPTGAGKSLLYQIPAFIKPGLSIIVSPLISLMKDQVDKLQELGLNADFINSSLTPKQERDTMEKVENGETKVLYVAPERFNNADFNKSIKTSEVGLLAVDEAHCFLSGTMVDTPYGQLPIEEIKEGDEVISWENNRFTVRQVMNTFRFYKDDVWRVKTESFTAYCDGGQEYYVKDTGYVRVDELQPNNEVIVRKSKEAKTEHIEDVSQIEQGSTLPSGEHIGDNSEIELHDIEVEGSRNFFANGCLVHNCISQWGHDFRPAYTNLTKAINTLNPSQVMALTATATPEVQEDICTNLKMDDAVRFVRGIYRPNLKLAAVHGLGNRRESAIAQVVKEYRQKDVSTGIIYTQTRKEADNLCRFLKGKGMEATSYHAGLSDKNRKKIQDDWAENGGTIVATCAFGMGIDRPDVRFVLHSGLSGSIEDWYQAIGRAGRDGYESLCMSMWDNNDYNTQMFLIDLTNPKPEDVQVFWQWLRKTAKMSAAPDEKWARLEMTQKDMSARSGQKNVSGCISALKRKGAVKTVGKGSYAVSMTHSAEFDFSDLERLREDKISKLNELVKFYKNKQCRVAFLADYFGDDSFSGTCGLCDNCGE